MKPMLAHRFANHKAKLPEYFYTQPKLNGVRAIYNNSKFQSRDEIIWHNSILAHLTSQLTKIIPPHYILDGELYHHSWSLQKINGAVSVNRLSPHKLTPEIEYHIFDLIDTSDQDLPFSARASLLEEINTKVLLHNLPNIRVVPTSYCNLLNAESQYSMYKSLGYEGLMYRHPDAAYGLLHNCGNKENRWTCLLKRKDWMDDDFVITDFNITEGDKGFRGFQLTCKTQNGLYFKVGSGLASGEIDEFIEHPPIGRKAKVRYEVLSDEGKPLKPTLEAVL
jgi:ATP-dependent DNA ligase